MEIKLKANILVSPEYKTHIGNMTIKNSEIVKFEKNENSHIIEYFSDNIFPIKRSEFEIQFLDKYDEYLLDEKDLLKILENSTISKEIKVEINS